MSAMHRRNYCLDNIEKKGKSDISTLGDDMPLIADRIFDCRSKQITQRLNRESPLSKKIEFLHPGIRCMYEINKFRKKS